MNEEKYKSVTAREIGPNDNDLILCVRTSPRIPEPILGDSRCYYERLMELSDSLLRRGIRELPEALAERIQFLTDSVPEARGNAMILVEPDFTIRPVSLRANGDPSRYDERMRFVVSFLNGEGHLLRQDSISIALKTREGASYVYRMEFEVEAAMERFLVRNIMDRRIRPLLEGENLVSGRGVAAFA